MAKNFEKLIFGGLHEKQRGIWVPTQHSKLIYVIFINLVRTSQETPFPVASQVLITLILNRTVFWNKT
jgi:hypothetical protein